MSVHSRNILGKKRLQTRQDRILTLANAVSISRIILSIPLVLILEKISQGHSEKLWQAFTIIILIILSDYFDDKVRLNDAVSRFFHHYYEALKELKEKESILKESVDTFFWKVESEIQKKDLFFESRIQRLDDFFHEQKTRYEQAFKEYLLRFPYKLNCDKIGHRLLANFNEYPRLKMYYLANQDRYASFYLASQEEMEEIKEILDGF